MSEKINIAEKARELIPLLRDTGINEVRFSDAKVESEGDWSPDYAIIQDVIPDTWITNEHYFDHGQLHYDLKEFVREHFEDDPSVHVEFHFHSDEIEVYRKGVG